MPLAPTQEFSYERDISPYASNFFNTIGNDSRLSPERKAQLQGTLLGGVQDIEAQRLKLQEERDKGQLRTLQFQSYQSDLEDARAKRIRMQQETESLNGVKGTVDSIIGNPDYTPEEKRQLLAKAEMEHPLAGDTTLGRMFNLGREMLPKDEGGKFTPTQTATYISRLAGKVAPEDLAIALQDETTLGVLLAQADAMEKEDEEVSKLRERKDADARAIKRGMMLKDLKYAKDEMGTPTTWLDEDSTRDAEMIVKALGNPEEQKQFDELRTAPSDEARYELVRSIQRRELDTRLGGKSESAADNASRARSLIFGK